MFLTDEIPHSLTLSFGKSTTFATGFKRVFVMDNKVSELQHLSSFFDAYAQAMQAMDTRMMTHFYDYPCMMISAEKGTAFNDATRLEGLFNQGIGFYKQFGVKEIRAEIWTKQQWSEGLANVKVLWQYRDSDGRLLYDCHYVYTMRKDKNGHWKIQVVLSVDEKEKMERWMQQREAGAAEPLQ